MQKRSLTIRIITAFCCGVMLCVIPLLCTGCANIPQPFKSLFKRIPDNGTIQIDWTMNGTVVNGDGTFVESVPVTIRGEIQDHYPETDEAQFEITLFNNYKKRCPEVQYSSFNRAVDGLPYYFFFEFEYEFALDPAKEYLIIQWDDGSGQYLVASRDPDVTAEEILEYFQGFIDWYAFD